MRQLQDWINLIDQNAPIVALEYQTPDRMAVLSQFYQWGQARLPLWGTAKQPLPVYDEGFAGWDSNVDGGIARRLSATLLTWMQEHQEPIYAIATVNRLGLLPPELVRRFEDIFFVDLPHREPGMRCLIYIWQSTSQHFEGIVNRPGQMTNGVGF
jgi:hypothetical protein